MHEESPQPLLYACTSGINQEPGLLHPKRGRVTRQHDVLHALWLTGPRTNPAPLPVQQLTHLHASELG